MNIIDPTIVINKYQGYQYLISLPLHKTQKVSFPISVYAVYEFEGDTPQGEYEYKFAGVVVK